MTPAALAAARHHKKLITPCDGREILATARTSQSLTKNPVGAPDPALHLPRDYVATLANVSARR
ncbi:hypothetical protein C8T65DRAFT_744257 [Cerioporus squamosus]|nr:hypothetical protein C8T65DRAFT_744257 [Cerioporus squamosus]